MPTEQRNGLTQFSLHAYDDAASGTLAALAAEGDAGAARPRAQNLADVDPETAARRHLDQALASPAIASLNAPEVNGTASDFKTIGTETVPLTGTRTVKFRQSVANIPIYGSLVTVELENDNSLVSIDSALGEPQGVDAVAAVSPADASKAAAAAPDGYTPDLKGIAPKLNYYYDTTGRAWRLVYIFEDVPVTVDAGKQAEADRTSGHEPPKEVDYVIDAHDGSVVAVLPRTPTMAAAHQGVEQTAKDGFGVDRTFLADKKGAGLVLRDPVHNVVTYDFGFGDPQTESDRLPGDLIANPPDWTAGAVSAHANAVAVSDYLRTVLQRDNIDGKGGAMISTINCVVASPNNPGPKQWVNAFWSHEVNQMVYGQVMHGDVLRSLSSNQDVVGHEMFHGVTDHTARLEYVSQSGAMNESFSDIFGTVIANRDKPDPRRWDWQIGEDLLPDDRPFRDMSDPPRFGDPGTMADYQDLPETLAGDWGGVHTNSGIHNKMAYDMFTAEDAHGDLALTPAEVAAVFYVTLTQRLSRTSQFIDSRRGAISTARSLFRTLPADQRDAKVQAVAAAYTAVGIE
jgi:Zn-dependent metalloprotease